MQFHESFYKGTDMKSVFEFELPADSEAHYNALKGEAYRQILTELVDHMDAAIKMARMENSPEADYLTTVLSFLGERAVEYDVKIFRK